MSLAESYDKIFEEINKYNSEFSEGHKEYIELLQKLEDNKTPISPKSIKKNQDKLNKKYKELEKIIEKLRNATAKVGHHIGGKSKRRIRYKKRRTYKNKK
jgi:hypothetical protein